MITGGVVIAVCCLILIAYLFDVSAQLTRIPSVIWLLAMGVTLRQATTILHIPMPDMEPLLPLLGTLGLILIVLEGALELELNRTKLPVIRLAFLNAILPLLIIAAVLTGGFMWLWDLPLRTAMVNAIPFCVISSAIAIPSVRGLSPFHREFVIYETSLSDITGVLFFNFILYNEYIDGSAFAGFGFELLMIIAISFVAVLGLSFLMSRIRHHVTYTPILVLVILIYYLSKEWHLPGLIFILVFGLFLGNLDELRRFKWLEWFHPEKLDKEVKKFHYITVEATFVVRVLFFMVFGYLLDPADIVHVESLPFAIGIVLLILMIRWVSLRISKLPSSPLLFIAPRGLITILLFISITSDLSNPYINDAVVVQVVLISVFLMMLGLMFRKVTPDAAEQGISIEQDAS